MSYEPFLIVLVGPSGVGKTTIAQGILEKHKEIRYSISATTRRPRVEEIDGRDYYFLDIPTFKKWIRDGKFYEWAIVYNDFYGTPKAPVEGYLKSGFCVIFDLDIQGAVSMKSKRQDSVVIFLLPPSMEELKRRLLERGDTHIQIDKRIREVKKEIEKATRFDYIIKNNVLEDTLKKVESIIMAEQNSTSRVRFKNLFKE